MNSSIKVFSYDVEYYKIFIAVIVIIIAILAIVNYSTKQKVVEVEDVTEDVVEDDFVEDDFVEDDFVEEEFRHGTRLSDISTDIVDCPCVNHGDEASCPSGCTCKKCGGGANVWVQSTPSVASSIKRTVIVDPIRGGIAITSRDVGYGSSSTNLYIDKGASQFI